MELRHLRAFLAVADEHHFSRAAARLHLAQPALSQQVKQLEREVGTVLFERTTRRVELTEAGHRLLPHARSVLAGVDDATADLRLLAEGRAGRVAIGFIGTSTYDVLPRVAREVRERLPDVDLRLRGELLSPALADGVLDGSLDLAVLRPDGVRRPGLELTRLRTERLVAVLPEHHPLAGRRRLDLARLAGETFVVHPPSSAVHAHVLAACARAGFQPASTVAVGETATLVVFVAAGQGVALVPEPVRSLALAGVTYVPLVDAPRVDLALASRPEASPTARRVAEIVAAVAAVSTGGSPRRPA